MKTSVCLLMLLVLSAVSAGEPTAPAAPAAVDDLEKVREEFRKRLDVPEVEFKAEVGEAQDSGGGVLTQHLSFPSPMKSVDPETNDTVRATLYRKADAEPAAVILLAGWGGEPLTPILALKLARESKLQVLHVQVPFQEGRTPKGRRSGQLTLSADFDQTVETFVQLGLDVHRAVRWLVTERKVDPKRVGVMGLSLGGFASATLYGFDDRFACCVSQLAGADVAKVLFNGNFLTARIRRKLAADGIDEAAARKALRPIAPATWADPKKKDGLMIVAGETDKIVRLENSEELAKAYGGARLEVMKGTGHIAFMELQEMLPKVQAHLEKHLGAKPAATGEGD